jgi:hypothetical protein
MEPKTKKKAKQWRWIIIKSTYTHSLFYNCIHTVVLRTIVINFLDWFHLEVSTGNPKDLDDVWEGRTDVNEVLNRDWRA